MKWIKSILLGLLVVLVVFIGVQYIQYIRSVNQVKADLPGESIVAETVHGPVEYFIQGESNQYVLLIHGTPGSYRTFMADVLLNHGFTIISPSRPGYFRTPLSSGKTIDAQADLYAALLDHLSIDSAAIIGFSGGGPSALKFASQYTNRCSGLVVIASTGRPFEEPSRPLMENMMMGTEFGRWMGYGAMTSQFEAADTGEIALDYLRSGFFPSEQIQTGERNDFQQFASQWKVNLTSIQCPTLIIHGKEDELIPFSEAIHLNNEIPKSSLIAKEGKDHFSVVFFEFDKSLKMAADFLNDHL